MAGLADQPLTRFLDVVRSTDPAPGGGSGAAIAAAIGAALLEMSAGIELARERPGDDEPIAADTVTRASELRRRALELADQDLSSFAPVLDVLRLPQSDPDRTARLGVALGDASRVPIEIAEAGATAAELALAVATASPNTVRGDALAAVLLSEAATAAATVLVEINLAGQDDGPDIARARDARRRAQEARDEALALLPRR